MIKYTGNFRCIILSPNRIIYENEVNSLFLKGDRGEFEILAYHYPILGVLVEGDIVINGNSYIPIKGGVLRFYANECTIMVEEEMQKAKLSKG
ncbi:MAG: hypothetical protein HQL26_10265 [Candidatus Omnitrophica bacterium]|nr:hypothetical protein [Candidatus Omnitrophota bacterium]